MSEEILVNVTPRETRVAVVENGMAQELLIERSARRGQVGNIYKGRVQRVMPGMQAAFVEIGLARSAFLHVSDVVRPPDPVEGNGNGAAEVTAALPSITELVHEGQSLIVQVVKDPISSKGARVTTQLSIPSRYLVYLPQTDVLGVSARIEDEEERGRLKKLMAQLAPDAPGGYIVRTNAEGQPEAAIGEDIAYLHRAWAEVRDACGRAEIGERVYEDLPLALRALRDLSRQDVDRVRVDSNDTYERMRDFAARFMPDLAARVEHYTGPRAIFDLYGIDDEIQRALLKEVPLKSGGHLVIDQTEAMTTVDVNTGSFLGQRNLEETVFRTNLEAAQAVARQLRLRNLGGIIIIDFIDMADAEHRRQVLRTLERSLARDRARTTVHDFSPLGLVEMTRKRTTDSLARQLCEPCPTSSGRGLVRTAETVTYEIFREVTRAARQFDARQLRVMAAPAVVDRILEEESAAVAELEEFLGRSVRFQAESGYLPEQFDVVLL